MKNLILNLDSRKKPKKFKIKELTLAFRQIFKKCNFLEPVEVNLYFISSKMIKKLNKKWRNIDQVTDVLSFGQRQIPGEKIRQLGDIFICLPQAQKQAKEKNHSLEKELKFLAIHGLKHLMGIHHK